MPVCALCPLDVLSLTCVEVLSQFIDCVYLACHLKATFGISSVDLQNIDLGLELGNREITIVKAELSGVEVKGSMTGTIQLQSDIMRSQLNLKGTYVTEKCIPHVLNMSNLEYLYFNDYPMPLKEIKNLKK